MFRTNQDDSADRLVAELFEMSAAPVAQRLEDFPKFVRRIHLKRFIALYELFKLVLNVKGSIVEGGVYRGRNLMAWAKLSSILEPENYTRRIFGFDTFEGFPELAGEDRSAHIEHDRGDLLGSPLDEVKRAVAAFDEDRPLGHIAKVELIAGDAAETIPKFVADNPHVVVALLFLDFDLYEPTKAALENFLPRMPKGAVLAFDELNNPLYPGETQAAMEAVGVDRLALRRFSWDPYVAYAVL